MFPNNVGRIVCRISPSLSFSLSFLPGAVMMRPISSHRLTIGAVFFGIFTTQFFFIIVFSIEILVLFIFPVVQHKILFLR